MIYSSWDIECDRLRLLIMSHFMSFILPPKNPKNQNFEKMKKNCWRYHHFTQMYQKPQPYEVQFLRYGVRQTEFWSFAFIPPNNHKNQTFKTMKKVYWHVITLHMCTKNHNQMMYAFWDMEYNRPNFLLFWAIFCPFTPLLTPQIKIWNKFKKTLEILSYYTCVP